MTRAEKRAYQAQLENDMNDGRPVETLHKIPLAEQCPVYLGKRHQWQGGACIACGKRRES